MENTLATLKSIKPCLNEAFLRSDNAGCYHNAYLILSLPSLGEHVGVKIVRYDFSEPQAGKDVCDRRIATIKSHMRRFINEGNDIESAVDMKTAIQSYGGVKGCYPTVAEIQLSHQNMTKHSMLPGIQSLNNFSYESTGLRVWKAYNVGSGKLLTTTQLQKYGVPQGPTAMKILQPFSQPSQIVGAYRSTTTGLQVAESSAPSDVATEEPQEESTAQVDALFSCPEDGCIKTYKSFNNLQKHLDVGRHLIKLERESVYDNVIKKWAETCKAVGSGYIQSEVDATTAAESATYEPSMVEGWALKKGKKSVRFSENVRSFLHDVFIQGEETGIKANAGDVASKMKNVRLANNLRTQTYFFWLSFLRGEKRQPEIRLRSQAS